jgi:plasmid maintenance system killer protein
MKIDEKIDMFLTEEREDFYEDRKKISERLRVIADRVSNMDLPDPDSDYYAKNRKNAKAVLSSILNAVERVDSTISLTLKSYKPF